MAPGGRLLRISKVRAGGPRCECGSGTRKVRRARIVRKPALCRRGVHRNDIGPSVHRFDPADRCDSNDLPARRASRSFQCHFCGHRRGDALTADRGILQSCSRQRRIRSICRRRCDLRRCWRRPVLRISLLMFFEGGELSVLAESITSYCSASMTALRVVDGRMTASVRAASGR